MSDSLQERIKELYEEHCRVHSNCWAVMSAERAVKIRESLSGQLNPGDRILVVRSGTEAAWRAGNPETSAWLKLNL